MITYVSRLRGPVPRHQLTRHDELDGVNSIWEKVRRSDRKMKKKPDIQAEIETETEHLLTQDRCAQGYCGVAATRLVRSDDVRRANEASKRLGEGIAEVGS